MGGGTLAVVGDSLNQSHNHRGATFPRNKSALVILLPSIIHQEHPRKNKASKQTWRWTSQQGIWDSWSTMLRVVGDPQVAVLIVTTRVKFRGKLFLALVIYNLGSKIIPHLWVETGQGRKASTV